MRAPEHYVEVPWVGCGGSQVRSHQHSPATTTSPPTTTTTTTTPTTSPMEQPIGYGERTIGGDGFWGWFRMVLEGFWMALKMIWDVFGMLLDGCWMVLG